MAYLSNIKIRTLGFKKKGKNILISEKASIYNYQTIEIGDNSRIDDFCIISGKVKIGRNVHITPGCIIAGGEKGVFIEDFVTLAYGVKVFAQSDDYSGLTMTNSTIPKQFKNETKRKVIIKKYTIIGAGAIIFPGVIIEEGNSIGAMSLILKSTRPWGIYAGVPIKKIKGRSKNLLKVSQKFLKSKKNIRV